ncbi:MAG: transporter substrate-binding domain-containing protein [Clostridia bacterium]|nr:transporter substrate-binding domain-containing protein [Clostridia bacterium]
MKRMLALLAGLVLILAMAAGCSSAPEAASDSAEPSQAADAASETPAAEDSAAESPASEESAASDAQGEVLKRIIGNGKLIVLTNAQFPPYEYMGSDGTPVGVDMDIAQAIADQIGVELEITDMEFDSLIPALVSGKGDIVAAGMTVDEERKQAVDFSDTYADAKQMIIVPVEGATVASEEDLAGKTIGVQLGTTGDLYVSDNVEGADVKQYKSALEAALDLKNGRLDAVVIDLLPAENIAASNEDLVLIDMASTDEQYAIAIEKNNEDLVEIINGVIAQLTEDGTIADSTAVHVEASRVSA